MQSPASDKTLKILEDSLIDALPKVIELEAASDKEVAKAYTQLIKQVQPELEEETISTYRKLAPKALKSIRNGPATLLCCSDCSFMRLFVRKPRDFSSRVLSVFCGRYSSHLSS